MQLSIRRKPDWFIWMCLSAPPLSFSIYRKASCSCSLAISRHLTPPLLPLRCFAIPLLSFPKNWHFLRNDLGSSSPISSTIFYRCRIYEFPFRACLLFVIAFYVIEEPFQFRASSHGEWIVLISIITTYVLVRFVLFVQSFVYISVI